LTWRVAWDDRARRELRRLDRQIQERILRFVRERISSGTNPRAFGAPLRADLAGLWKYRMGDYRIICKIEDRVCIVLILRVAHRKVVYD
jgi:mRNA interferase RelE/StbE